MTRIQTRKRQNTIEDWKFTQNSTRYFKKIKQLYIIKHDRSVNVQIIHLQSVKGNRTKIEAMAWKFNQYVYNMSFKSTYSVFLSKYITR